MGKKKTHEEFVQEVYDKYGDDYEVLGKYINAKTNMLVKHKCGYEWDVLPDNLLRRNPCPNCNKKIKWNTETFKKEVFSLYGDEYEVLGEYKKDKIKISIKHICGFIHDYLPYQFLNQKSKCPVCSKHAYQTTESFKEKVKIKTNDEYELLGEYNSKYVKIKHKICGNEWDISPTSFMSAGSRCPICAINKGEKHYNWKGGISNLHEHLRKILVQWKKDSMINCNYKCVITSNRFDDIHHLYPFHLIINEIFDKTKLPIYELVNQYSTEELNLLEQECIKLHYKYGLGICLINELHKEFHKIYSETTFTPEDFQEFYYLKTGKFFDLNLIRGDDIAKISK